VYNLIDEKVPTIIITGANGFIGGILLQRFHDRILTDPHFEKHRIKILLRSAPTFEVKKEMSKSKRIDVELGDLSDLEFVMSTVRGNIEYIYHSAARGGDWGDMEEYMKCNVQATKNLLDAAILLKNFKRFLHVSTVDVYPHEVYPKDCYEHVTIPLENRTYGYTLTKSIAESLVLQAYRENNLPVSIVRPAAVYGRGTQSYGFVEAEYIGECSGVFVSGSDTPSGLVHVDDCIDLFFLAAEAENSIGEIYNCSDNYDVSWRQFYDAIAIGLRKPTPFLNIPRFIAYTVAFLQESYFRFYNIVDDRPYFTAFLLRLISVPQLWPTEKAKLELGWKPRVSFEEGMLETLKFLKTYSY